MNADEIKIEIENKISTLVSKVKNLPNELIPKVNKSNDLAYPYIDIGFDGTLYLVVRERGIEHERLVYNNVEALLREVFKRLSLELAIKEELNNRIDDSEYSVEKIKNIQESFMKIFNPDWSLE